MIIRKHDDWVRELKAHWGELEHLIQGQINVRETTKTIPQLLREPSVVIADDIERALREGDYRRIRLYLQETWWRAPDDPNIHDVPGWDVLCELLAEDWALNP